MLSATSARILTILASCTELLTDACGDHELDFELTYAAAARYIARAALVGPVCEDTDLLCAVAQQPAPTPFDGLLFACIDEALDAAEVVLWDDDSGDDGRYVLSA